MNKALNPDQIIAVHIDNGFMRKGESEMVKKSLEAIGVNVKGNILFYYIFEIELRPKLKNNIPNDISKTKADIRQGNSLSINSKQTFNLILVVCMALLDILMIVCAWLIAIKLSTQISDVALVGQTLLLIVVVNLGIMIASGLYGTEYKSRSSINLIKSLTLAHLTFLCIAFLLIPGLGISRLVFVSAWLLTLTLVGSERFMLRFATVKLRKKIWIFTAKSFSARQ